MQKIKIDDAVKLCREIEGLLKPIGYHCGLTGSTLYKGESSKDIDIIIYPHQVDKQVPINQIIDTIGVETVMYKSQGEYTARDIQPSSTDKLIIVGEYKGIRVDLFFLE